MKRSNLDVHNLSLDEAIKVINHNIDLSYNMGISVLYVNHGFNNGTKIKTWCKEKAILHQHVVKVDSGDNEGISRIYIKIKIN